jgi:hypothetical protein
MCVYARVWHATVPQYNEFALKRHMDTSVHLQVGGGPQGLQRHVT